MRYRILSRGRGGGGKKQFGDLGISSFDGRLEENLDWVIQRKMKHKFRLENRSLFDERKGVDGEDRDSYDLLSHADISSGLLCLHSVIKYGVACASQHESVAPHLSFPCPDKN